MPSALRRHWLTVAVGIVVVGLLIGWWRVRTSVPRVNLLLITLDTTRADRLGAWGGPENLTPILDQLASQSVVFERAYAPVPLTLPSHTSLMTGLYPPEHGLRVNSGLHRLGPEIPVLSESLKQRGYRTGAFVGAFVLDRQFGLDRGFDLYDDRMEETAGPTPGDSHGHKMRHGQSVVDAALAWLKRKPNVPFFCWVHLFDPHTPYDARPQLYGDRFQDRPYDAGIAYVDGQVGRLLDYLRQNQLDERTMIVVLGDHGESLGEHGERSHGFTLYNATLQVPLMIRGTGPEAPVRRVSTPVSIVDLYPTLMAALSPGTTPVCSGRNLWPACQGEELPALALYAESNHPFEEAGAAPLRGLVSGDWKYIRSPRRELYDLRHDPEELKNLADAREDDIVEWERQLEEKMSAFRRHDTVQRVVSPHEAQKLTSLGYTGGGSTPQIDAAQWPDIKDVLPHYNTYADAQQLIGQRNFQEAAPILERVVAAVPNFFQAWYNLGVCRQFLADLPGAEQAYLRAVEIDGNATSQTALGAVYLAQNQPERAVAPLEIAVRLQPELARGHFLLGEAYRMSGRRDDARNAYLESLSVDPEFQPAQQSLDSLPDNSGKE